MTRVVLLLALLVTVPLLAPAAQACASVPCGRIYPSIVMTLGDGQGPKVFDAKLGVPVTIEATLTYRFDMQQDGYTATAPNEPILISFEYPRKPQWVDLKVEPESLTVPVNDPRFIQPKPDPNALEANYVWTTPITITATVQDQAILKDGYDFAKLLVFAKSTESGLYQSGYGIKEVRLRPEGALHESEVAGLRDVFTASPLPPLDLQPVEATVAGITATLTPPDAPQFWVPATWVAKLTPAPTGQAFLAMHDEAGNLVATAGPMPAASDLKLNATLAKPGLHTVTVTLLPDAGTRTPPVTIPLDLVAGVLDAEGWQFGKAYLVQTSAPIPAPNANPNPRDAFAQWERDVPFFAFDNAQSVNVQVTLTQPTLATASFTVVDPDGKLLLQSSVDPQYPQKTQRLGSVPSEGWYVLRLRGAGSPVASMWDARIEVAYATPPQARNHADALPDPTGGLLAVGARNLTLPLDDLGVWTASDVTPTLDRANGMTYALTITDAEGALAYASGARTGAASFTPPAPGVYRAFLYGQAATPGEPFSPLVRAFTFTVGAGETVTATTFPLTDAPLARTSPTEGLLALYALPKNEGGAGEPKATGGRAVIEDGLLAVYATNAGPQRTVPVELDLAYAQPQTLVGPDALGASSSKGDLPVPGFAAGALLIVAGLVAIGVALVRRP